MPLILPGNVASALPTGFDVANSCRFNDGDSPQLSKSQGSGNVDQWTYSCWIKRGTAYDQDQVIFAAASDSSNKTVIQFQNDINSYLKFYVKTSGSYVGQLHTNRYFRDPGAWCHIVAVYDSGNGVAGNRMRLYINGIEETSFLTDNNPSSDANSQVNDGSSTLYVGAIDGATFFDGYMAEVCLVDGQALAASDFGEFDEDSPTIWKPKKVSGLTFGTNGFYLDFKASANLGNDANGGTDLTESNIAAADQATDTPTNNFCTINPLYYPGGSVTLAEGNCKLTPADSRGVPGTMGVKKGKWYFEQRPQHTHYATGIVSGTAITGGYLEEATFASGFDGYEGNRAIAYCSTGSYQYLMMAASTTTDWGATLNASTDILGIAVDLDNSKLYFAKNNAWQNSGDPTSGATGTGAVSITAHATTPALGDIWWFPFGCAFNTTVTMEFNFGGCSAFTVSSAANDGNGYGNFEYAPPSGFYSLCTKNLAEYG